MTEFEHKQMRIRALLDEYQLDALLLRRVSNVTWATCGAKVYVNIASSDASAVLLITRTQRYLITNNLEAARFEQEEHLDAQGWEFRVAPWYESSDEVARLTRGMKLGADGAFPGALDLARELARLRIALTPEECERFRTLGQLCADAVEVVACSLEPGRTEQAISARLGYEAELRCVQAVTNIVATDWRIGAFRHALPTDKPLERYAMLVLNGRRWGLVCTVTRFVHIGELSDDLRRRNEITAHLFAEFICATRPGKSFAELFELVATEYARAGFPAEWHQHHQGGSVGYEPREFFVTPQSSERIAAHQAFVWNPSIGDVRSVDTFLVGETENKIITASESWQTLPISVGALIVPRPVILEL